MLTLTGTDKPGTLSLAINHLVWADKDQTKPRTPMVIEMGWVRDVGGPGGVMLRFRTNQETLDAIKAGQNDLQRLIANHSPKDVAGQPPQMQVTIRTAAPASQFDESRSHLLVFRYDQPRAPHIPGAHDANRRSLAHFFAMLADDGVDIAQYESVQRADGSVEHAIRLFEYEGRGESWLISAVDRANRLSVVRDQRQGTRPVTPSELIDAMASTSALKEADARCFGRLHPIDLVFGGDDSDRDFEAFIQACLETREVHGRKEPTAERRTSGEGFLTVSVHGNDRNGFFIDCLHVLETTPTDHLPIGSRREVVRSGCRGLGKEGFVLAVACGHKDEVACVKEALQRMLQSSDGAKQTPVSQRDVPAIPEARDTGVPGHAPAFADLRSDVVWLPTPPTAVGYSSDTDGVYADQFTLSGEYSQSLAKLIHQVSAIAGTNINFLDVRAKSADRREAGCAIAVIHKQGDAARIQEIFSKVQGLRLR